MFYLFFLVAFFYSIVGFGGGSSYIAIMALQDLPYEIIPSIALVCNIIVVCGGTFHFTKSGHHRWPLSWPFILGSVPLSFIGASIPISKMIFMSLLGFSLLCAGLRLLFLDKQKEENTFILTLPKWPYALAIGCFLGLLSGLVGIGGGIFLSPILLNMHWGSPKQIAATTSLFILVNSLSGLTGQLIRHVNPQILLEYWPLFLAVLCGGQLGSLLGSRKIPQVWIAKGTAALVVMVGVRSLLKAFGL